MAEATNLALGTITLTGDLSGNAQTPVLKATGVLPGTYKVANLVVNNKGLVVDAIEGDPELNVCATTSSCGTVVVGKNISVTDAEISIPLATTTNKGVIKIGSGFTMDGCVLSADYPIATETTLGLVKVPVGGNIDVDGSGNISIPIATDTVLGLIKYGTDIGDVGEIDGKASLILPIATDSTLGGIKVDSNVFEVEVDGTLNLIGMQIATESSLGVVQIGDGFDADVNGIISVDLSEVSMVESSDITLGGIKIGNGLDIDGSAVCSVNPTELLANGVNAGTVIVGSNINLSTGTISVADASTSTKGVVQIGTNTGLSVSAGVLNGVDATTSIKGVIKTTSPESFGLQVSGGILNGKDATNSTRGIVQIVPDTGLSITAGALAGVNATTSTKGVVQIGTNTGLTIASGLLSGVNATTLTKGVVQIGSHMNVSSGIISMSLAEGNSSYGVVASANIDHVNISSGSVSIGSQIPVLSTTKNVWTKSQVRPIIELTYGSSISVAASSSDVFYLNLTGDCTLNALSSISYGVPFYIIVQQDVVGGRNLSFHNYFKFNNLNTTINSSSNGISVVVVTPITATMYATTVIANFL